MIPRAIVVLVDGLPATEFAAWRDRLTSLSAMAQAGFLVERLTPSIPTVSRPGRAVLLTGQDTASHGVSGNNVLDGDTFRPAEARDIVGPTLASVATAAGRRVAGIGFGMLDPAHTAALLEPWWTHASVRGETNLKLPQSPAVAHDPHRLIGARWQNGTLSESPARHLHGMLHPQLHGLASDHRMIELAGDLACGEDPPELILTEIAVTDTIMHYHGHASPAAAWVAAMADLMLGRLAQRLRDAGRWDDTLLAIVSDHGMASITTALYPEHLLPDATWATEGATLQVRLAGAPPDLDARLTAHGITRLPDDNLPPPLRGVVAQFAAAEGCAFEKLPDDGVADGRPLTISTHGNAPGTAGDDGILILSGGLAPCGRQEAATMTRFAPTVAAILGLDLGARADMPLVSAAALPVG